MSAISFLYTHLSNSLIKKTLLCLLVHEICLFHFILFAHMEKLIFIQSSKYTIDGLGAFMKPFQAFCSKVPSSIIFFVIVLYSKLIMYVERI